MAFHSGCHGGSPRDAEHDTVKTLVIVKTADDTKVQSATVHVLGPRQFNDGPGNAQMMEDGDSLCHQSCQRGLLVAGIGCVVRCQMELLGMDSHRVMVG